MTAGKSRPEALLEREVLRHVGTLQRSTRPRLLAARNEVGEGFTGNVGALLQRELCADCARTAREVLMRNRIAYGLGVGSPDLLLAVEGRALFIELKSDSGRMRPDQDAWHAAAEQRGVLVRIARSVADVDRAIEEACTW